MVTLAQLRTRILDKLSDGSVQYPTAAQVDAQINSSIDFFENKPFWFNQAVETLTATIGDKVLSGIPSNFKQIIEPDGLVLSYSGIKYTLRHVQPIQYDNADVGGTGQPYCYTYRDGQFQLYWYPDQEYTIFLHYQKSYADLTAEETNDWLTYADRLIEYKTLADLLRDYRSDEERATSYDGGTPAMGMGGKVAAELFAVQNESYNRTSTGTLICEDITSGSSYGIDGNYFTNY